MWQISGESVRGKEREYSASGRVKLFAPQVHASSVVFAILADYGAVISALATDFILIML